MCNDDRPFSAYLDEMNMITILLPDTYHHGVSAGFFLTSGMKKEQRLHIEKIIHLGEITKYICISDEELDPGIPAWIIDEHKGKTDLQIGSVIRTREFDNRFYYSGNDLGVTYSKEKVIFKLWAPTATEVKVKLTSPNGGQTNELVMNRQEKGVWTLEKAGDFEQYHYSFLLYINRVWQEAVDPYSCALTANGKCGVIVDLEKIRSKKHNLPPLSNPTDAIIYETHIRDFTIHPNSGVANMLKGTYLGAAETGTTGIDGKCTCLSYVKDLGITHIELLPINDFAGVDETGSKQEYNWGYNPLHFNAPEGSYASDPNDPYTRIHELKALINAIHEQDLRVIIDVVYNHVYIREQSSFEKIVPGYYFRHDEYGMPSNGTGVGNDIASERMMVRKFIVDSVVFWMKEYQVDGFRFDLMGILDVDTMNEIRKTIDCVDDTAIIIGEGWDLNTPLPPEKKANIRNQRKLQRIAQFNDWFRDSIKGSTFNLYDRGYALGNDHYFDAAKQVLCGSIGLEKASQGIFQEPTQTVNYVESHDNHTLWDKLEVCHQDLDPKTKMKRHRLATCMVILSQGIPFLHSGQEFFRTKRGIGNSYRSPDMINQLDWSRKSAYQDQVDFIKGIIDIRMSHGALRLSSASLIRKHMMFLDIPKPCIGYCLSGVGDYGKWDSILVFINPTDDEVEMVLPKKEYWYVLANGHRASAHPLGKITQIPYLMAPISISVLVH
jgi:pullulanase